MTAIVAVLGRVLTGRNIVIAIFILMGIALTWQYKTIQFERFEKERVGSNADQEKSFQRKFDSLKFAHDLKYTKEELKDYLEKDNPKLDSFLKQQDIKVRNIQRIVANSYKYRDDRDFNVDLNPVLEAIRQNKVIKVPIIDSTKCLVIKGEVIFANDTLDLNIKERRFQNNSDAVAFLERNQWSFLGLWKWRLFGKKQIEVIIRDDCGNTTTKVIDVVKKGKDNG